MDTDDDISALEEEEEEVALLCHANPSCELELSHPSYNPEPTCSSPCNSEPSCPPTQSSTTSRDDLLSSDNEDDPVTSLASRTPPYSFSASRRECRTVVRYVIQSARTQITKEEKFVVYTVEAQRFLQYSEGEDGVSYEPILKKCATFERRYSEFLSVYNALMDSHRSLMEEFEGFPKKVLIGNFSMDVITDRCKGLARFMNFVQDEGVLSRTAVFSKFLYHPEVTISNNLLLHSQFEEACPILENTYILLSSLHWDTGLILRTLCQLIVCLHAVSNYDRAYVFSQIALKKFKSHSNRKIGKGLYFPLLMFCDSLWRLLGKDKTYIRSKIELLRKQRRQEDVVPNLLDVLRDEIALRTLH
ncbi:sorting nexin-20-like [Homarus americanus]|nr:sorting nexin-20-like [Homarus americanus]